MRTNLRTKTPWVPIMGWEKHNSTIPCCVVLPETLTGSSGKIKRKNFSVFFYLKWYSGRVPLHEAGSTWKAQIQFLDQPKQAGHGCMPIILAKWKSIQDHDMARSYQKYLSLSLPPYMHTYSLKK